MKLCIFLLCASSCVTPTKKEEPKYDHVQLNVLCMQYCIEQKQDFGIVTQYEPDPQCICFTKVKPDPI